MFLKNRKIIEKDKEYNKIDKKFIKRFFIIFIFMLINSIVLYTILNSDDFFKENDTSHISIISNESNIDNSKLNEHTRYINKDTLDTLHKDSKWRNNEELNTKLRDTFEQNIEEIKGYTVKSQKGSQ